MQQAFFSPGPESCPAWALPRVMALVRVLFCLCLDTFAKISKDKEQSSGWKFNVPPPNHAISEHRWPPQKEFLLEGSCFDTWVLSTFLGKQGTQTRPPRKMRPPSTLG